MNLNKQQQFAVDSPASAILALGVPGCGKTTVIAERVERLLKDGASPFDFLMITFTRKAAQNLKDKIGAFLNARDLRKITIGTSHGFCLSVVRQWAEKIGYGENITIYDEVDQKDIIQGLIDSIGYRKLTPRKVLDYVNEHQANRDKCFHDSAEHAECATVYSQYLAKLKQYNALDYDLILVKAVWILQNVEQALPYYQNRYKHLFYDEFQDLASLENDLMLTMGMHNCFVVGDPDQNIYKFRGTNIKYILDFENAHPGCEVINLEQNYRSTPEICLAANSLIKNNIERVDKTVRAVRPKGEEVQMFLTSDEAKCVVESIRKSCLRGYTYKDIAVLVRTNKQIDPIIEALNTALIPTQRVVRDMFWQRREIKDALAFLHVINNPRDDFNTGRILKLPYLSIDNRARANIRADANSMDLSLLEAAEYQSGALRMFSEYAQAAAKDKYWTARQAMEWLLEWSGYVHDLEARGLETRAINVRSIMGRIADLEERSPDDSSLNTFLAELSDISAIDSWDEDTDAVAVMTMHCAKGLEWPVVHVAGCCEGLCPMRPNQSSDQIEEERRLFYVAITRAKDELILTTPKENAGWGKPIPVDPSRFLAEMKGE